MALTVEDRMAILDLTARYNHAFDYGEVDEWVQTFTSDGIFRGGEGFSRQGIEELTAFATKNAEGDMIVRHWISSQVIDGDGDSATHSCYLMVILTSEEPTIFGIGKYHDKLKKVNGEWKFSCRQLTKECEKR